MTPTPPGTPGKPTPNNLDELLKTSTELQSSLGKVTDEFEDMNKAAQNNSAEVRNIISLSTRLNNTIRESLSIQSKVGKEYVKVSDITREVNKLRAKESEINANIVRNQSKVNQAQEGYINQIMNGYQRIDKLAGTIADKTKEWNEQTDPTKKSNLTAYITKLEAVSAKIQSNNDTMLASDNLVNQIVQLKQMGKITDGMINNWETIGVEAAKFNKTVDSSKGKIGLLGDLMKGMSKIPIIGNFVDTAKVIDVMEAKMKETGSRSKTLSAGLKALGNDFERILSDPLILGISLFAITAKLVDGIVESVFEYNKLITDTSNQLALSKGTVQDLFNGYSNIALANKSINSALNTSFLTITNQAKAMSELNDSFGTAAMYSAQRVQSEILLTKQLNLSAEEAKGLQQYSLMNSTNVAETVKSILKETSSSLSYKRVLSEVSKISGQLAAQYKNNPTLIAAAVVQTNRLGLSLEEAKKASDSLLDFQSSIENELSAELLNGKQINLEKARSLALDGQSAAASKEMLAQVGSYASYMQKNVLQQDALSKSVGMTSNELADTLKQQETLRDIGFDSTRQLQEQLDLYKQRGEYDKVARLEQDIRNKSNGDALLQQLSQVSLQAQFQQSLERVKELFTEIASEPVLKVLNGMAKMLSNTSTLKTALIGIAAVVSGIAASLITTAFVLSPISAMLGAALGATVVGGLASKGLDTKALEAQDDQKKYQIVNDGIVTPHNGITLQTPAGQLIRANHNDSAILTTRPQDLLSPQKQSADNKEVVSRLDSLIALIKKGGNVYLDSGRVGSQMGMGYSAYA